MKFLIIGDLHGVRPEIYFNKSDFDAIIVPGDVCSDKNLRDFTDIWVQSWLKSKTPYKDWVEFLDGGAQKQVERFEKQSLRVGNRILKYLDSFGKPIYFIPGNWDQSYGISKIPDGDEDISNFHKAKKNIDKMYGKTNKGLIKGLKNIVDCQLKLHKEKDFNILGYGCSSFPEKKVLKNIKRSQKKRIVQKAYDKILNKLNKEYKKRNKNLPTIFLSHNMPYMTKMDKILKEGSVVTGKHYGSSISKDFIKENSPLLCIGGHMHEYMGKQKVYKTTLINSGFGAKVNTFLEIKSGKIKKIKFIKKCRRRKINRKVGW